MGSGRKVDQGAGDSGGTRTHAAVSADPVVGLSTGPGGAPLHADELPDGVVVADARGRVVLFNSLAAQLIGSSAESALGRDYRSVLPLVGPDGHDWWEASNPYGGA